MPVYNVEQYLSESIESVLHQTFKNFELILVNDGSTDKSGEICEKYAKIDKRIKVINKNNEGAGKARNIGIKASIGDFIAFIDSDDTVDLDMYRKMISLAIEKNSDIVMCGYREINYLTNTDEIRIYPLGECVELEKMQIKTMLEDFLKKNKILGYASMCNKIYKRDTVIKNQIFVNEEMRFAEDLLFNITLLTKVKKISAIKEPLYKYRRINCNSIMNSEKDLYEIFKSREAALKTMSTLLSQETYIYCLGYQNAITITSYSGIIKEQLMSNSSFITKLRSIKCLLGETYLVNAIQYYDKKELTLKIKIISAILFMIIKCNKQR